MIPTNHQEQYNGIVERIKSDYFYPTYQKEWAAFFNYLEGQDTSIPVFSDNNNQWLSWLFVDLIEKPQNWSAFDKRIMTFFNAHWQRLPNVEKNYYKESFAERWSRRIIFAQNDTATVEGIVRVFKENQIDEILLVTKNFYLAFDENGNITALGQYILSTIEQLLAYHRPIFMPSDENDTMADVLIHLLLVHNASKYESFIVEILDKISLNKKGLMKALAISERLSVYFPQKYKVRCLEQSYAYLNAIKYDSANKYYNFDYDNQQGNQYQALINRAFHLIFDNEPYEDAFSFIHNYLKNCLHTDERIVNYLTNRLGEKSLPILIDLLDKNEAYYSKPHEAIFNYLKNVPHEAFYPQLRLLAQQSSKTMRLQAATHFARVQGEAAIPYAQKLLGDKKGELRLVGAVLLSLIKTENALDILKSVLDTETNDDARDAILEALVGVLPPINDVEAGKALILKAKTRKKLDKPLAVWLNTEGGDFPKLYWTNGVRLHNEDIAFLFYRMNRTKDIRIDIEVQPIIALIDKSKSADFAKFLLKKYFDNGAEPKQKWCMTLAAMLGGFDALDLLKRKIDEWVVAKRGKMAECAITALALNGSPKALRSVEVFSRKYKNKAANIGTAANAAFTLAAEQLGISRYDLADMIIPDFDFVGLFRTFEVGGETYRAFINNDFKIVFLNEDNQLLKTLPKGTSPRLKEEFKEIAKEVRDIVKAQSSRLEQYLVIQRKWTVEKWDAFFRGNPIMFAYTVRLIWGIFDEKQNLMLTFQCLEDQTLVNSDGDELDLEEYTEGGTIGMIHPMLLNEEQINYWETALYEATVQPIFPQLDRPVVHIKELDKDTTVSKKFKGIKYSAHAFVSKIEKSGWVRDNGRVYTYNSYYKDFVDLGIAAVLTQDNYFSLADSNAQTELGELMFLKRKSIESASSTYAEPQTSPSNGYIPFGKLPPIVYSEVMADMLFFKENQVKKETN